MRVIRFPAAAAAELAGRAAGEQIDAMLGGELAGEQAVGLRELREDVRALAPPVGEDFERALQARVAEWGREARSPRPGLQARAARLRGGRPSGTPVRLAALGGAGAAVAAVVVVLALSLSGGNALHSGRSNAVVAAGEESAPRKGASRPAFGTAEQRAHSGADHLGTAVGPEASAATGTAAQGRLQQLGASVTLAAHGSEGVQEAADAVSRLATDDGGFLESSHVQVRQGGPSEAQLHLSIPSSKLSAAIAALGRIAPVRAVNQESQDITGSYEAAKRQLGDDEAVRRALLRALAAATGEGQIDSLRERLASNREALSRDRAQLHSIAHTAATSQLEVTITGAGSAASPQGTLDRGLHDAGEVLAVAGAIALVALAAIVPLALLALVLDALRRSWQRRRREGALEP